MEFIEKRETTIEQGNSCVPSDEQKAQRQYVSNCVAAVDGCMVVLYQT